MTVRSHTPFDAALQIVKRLRAAGHEALFAGGCVRDKLLGQEPKDYDVATDASPQHVITLFPRAKCVGAKFGVTLVRRLGHEVEVATFRTEGTYSDGRHPDSVAFGTAREDAKRRDFTINGLFQDPIEDRVIDYVAGREDLRAGIVRTIGNPKQRFQEDHLRMLRAVRFAAKLGFAIDPETLAAVRRFASCLGLISPERIWMEVEQILMSPSRVAGWDWLVRCGLHEFLCPAWKLSTKQCKEVGQRLERLPATPVSAALALAAVLTPLPGEQVEVIARQLRLSNQLLSSTVWLVASLPKVWRASELELADVKTLMANPNWQNLLELLHADLVATAREPTPYEAIKERAKRIELSEVAPPPLLSGDDLQAMDVEPGPEMGAILREIYRAQLNEQIRTRLEAIELAKQLARS